MMIFLAPSVSVWFCLAISATRPTGSVGLDPAR